MTYRVAYICEFSTLLGGERSLLTLIESAGPAICPVVVCPPDGPFPKRLDELCVPRIAWTGRAKEADPTVANELRTRGIQIVHGNSLSMTRIVRSIATETGLRTVAHVRDIMRLSSNQKADLEAMDSVIAVSDAVQRFLHASTDLGTKIRHIANGVVLPRATDVIPSRCDLGLPEDRRLVACIGQISLRKGQDVYLIACRKIASVEPNVDFLLLGERYSSKQESIDFENRLRDMATSPPLAGRFHWLGYRDDARTILRHIDLLVVPSRQEPLSRVLLEGLAAGVRCVATDVGGSAEILSQEDLGILVPADDAAAMAIAIRRGLADEKWRKRVRTRGPEHVMAHFSTASHVRQVLELYRQITE